MRILQGLLLIISVLCIQSCATIFHGGKQEVYFNSNINNTEVLVDGNTIGVTPTSKKLKRKNKHSIEFKKEGYTSQNYMSSSSYNGLPWLTNLIWYAGYPIAMVVDHSTGATYDIDQTIYNAHLESIGPKSFIRNNKPKWFTIELRDNLKNEDAWKKVRDIIIRQFDVEIMSKDDGYLRSSWAFNWDGNNTGDYRVRVTTKFNKQERKVEFKTEAQLNRSGSWILGFDTELVKVLKSDLMGSIGHVTR